MDTKRIILKSLVSLESFNELIKARKKYVTEHEVGSLTDWYVLNGLIWLDTCANVWLRIKRDYREPDEDYSDIPFIFAKGEWKPGKEQSFSYTVMNLPTHLVSCPGCNFGWDLDNIEDFISVGNAFDISIYHKKCYKLHNAETIGQKIRSCFDVASKDGFKIEMHPIENEYCGCDLCSNWYKVETVYGNFIVGWRKRVITLKYTGKYKINIGELINDDVTKDERYIHAWGYTKLVEYLTQIFTALHRSKIEYNKFVQDNYLKRLKDENVKRRSKNDSISV